MMDLKIEDLEHQVANHDKWVKIHKSNQSLQKEVYNKQLKKNQSEISAFLLHQNYKYTQQIRYL